MMGTNYYLFEPSITPLPAHNEDGEFKPDRLLHIGKSSHGWCFGLHVIPELGINDLDDWMKLFNKQEAVLFTEYGHLVAPAGAVTGVITARLAYESVDRVPPTDA